MPARAESRSRLEEPAGRPRLRQRPGLLAVTVLAAVCETALLWGIGLSSSRELGPQITAPSPFAEFHDIRWLLVFNRSWLALAAEAVLILLVRSGLNTVIVHQAWPDGNRPALLVLWRRCLLFSLVAFVAVAPWAGLLFGLAVTPISWLWFAAVPPVVVMAVLLHHGAADRQWWRSSPPLTSIGLILLTVVVLSVASAVMGPAPAWLWLPIAAAVGLFNGWAWLGIVHAAINRPAHRTVVPLAPAGIVVMVAVAIVGTAVGFTLMTARPKGSATQAATTPQSGPPVLVVSGFDTTSVGWDPKPIPGPFDERRFSYRGVDATGRPLTYTATDTHRSVSDLVRLMATQVDEMARQTGQPVSIVAESEGSIVAKVYSMVMVGAPVARLVLLSPVVQPGRVYYPAGGHAGWGLVAGYELRAATSLLGAISPLNLPADSPLLRSLVDHAGALRYLLGCPAVGIPQLNVVPLADAVAASDDPVLSGSSAVIPAFHGGLLSDHAARRTVARVLQGGRLPNTGAWSALARSIGRASQAWQIPSLPLRLYPNATSGRDGVPSCDAMTRALHQWIPGP